MGLLSVDEKNSILQKRGFYPTAEGKLDKYYDYWFARDFHFIKGISYVELKSTQDETVLQRLFEKDSITPQEVVWRGKLKWAKTFGSSNLPVYYIRPDCLDPYAARYVRVINSIGIRTCYSCDGWHNNPRKARRMFIWFYDRYSYLWHQILCETPSLINTAIWKHNRDSREIFVVLSRNEEKRIKIYNDVNDLAREIEERQDFYVDLKNKVVEKVKGKKKNPLPDIEIEEMLRDAIREFI